jgi:hypothetical protein
MSVFEIPREGGAAGSVTMGSQVDAAFRLFDQLPFAVRQDMAKLIYLYMHDPVGYEKKRRDLFPLPLDQQHPPFPAEQP